LQAIERIVSTLGFPIFVALWLLLRTDKLLREIKTTLDLLREAIITGAVPAAKLDTITNKGRSS
jgi:hypothetical protein